MSKQVRNSVAVWFEIPTADHDRCVGFYEGLFGIEMHRDEMGPMKLAIFPYDDPGISGCVQSGPGCTPGADGSVVYLNCDGRLDSIIERVEKLGGTVASPKTALPEGMGRLPTSSIPKGTGSACTKPPNQRKPKSMWIGGVARGSFDYSF